MPSEPLPPITDMLAAWGRRLFEIRDGLGLTQEQLAAEIGVTRQTISGYETGQYAPSRYTQIRIMHALECGNILDRRLRRSQSVIDAGPLAATHAAPAGSPEPTE